MNDVFIKISLWVCKKRSTTFHIVLSLCTGFLWTILFFVCKWYLTTIDSNNQVIVDHKISEENKAKAILDSKKLICPNCHSDNISVQMVAEQKKRSFLTILIYILLACTVIGLIILIPLMRGQKSKTRKYYVCQNCGKNW